MRMWRFLFSGGLLATLLSSAATHGQQEHLEIVLDGTFTDSGLAEYTPDTRFRITVEVDQSLADLVIDDDTIAVFDDPWKWHLGPDDGPIIWWERFRTTILTDNDPLIPVLPWPFGEDDFDEPLTDFWPDNCPACFQILGFDSAGRN